MRAVTLLKALLPMYRDKVLTHQPGNPTALDTGGREYRMIVVARATWCNPEGGHCISHWLKEWRQALTAEEERTRQVVDHLDNTVDA